LIRLQFRHDQVEVLEKLKELSINLVRVLDKKIGKNKQTHTNINTYKHKHKQTHTHICSHTT